MFFFLRFVEKYAVETEDVQRSLSISTWEKAYELWENSFKKEEQRSMSEKWQKNLVNRITKNHEAYGDG